MRPLYTVAEAIALLYIAGIAATATFTGFLYLLFPELAALSQDVLTRPRGKWASQPLRLLATPVLTAILGTLVTQHLPYHVLSVLLIVGLSLLVMRLLRSAIAPAISAGVLPLVLGVKSWMYPLAILFGVAVLVGLLIAWRKGGVLPRECPRHAAGDIDDVLESQPGGRLWLAVLLVFVTGTGLAAQVTGLRFILFPPLIVMAYEMLGHPETYPWVKRPLSLPVVCFLTALGGFVATRLLGTGPLAAACSMACGVVALRIFDVHMPPALAIGLIPLVMDAPDIKYPLSVAVGTIVLTGSCLVWWRIARAFASTTGLAIADSAVAFSQVTDEPIETAEESRP